MYKVACSRKEASCIIGSLLVELAPVCEKCGGLPDGVLNLQTEAGLSLTGDADVLITGHSIISGKPVRIKLTDYGFEYYGACPRSGKEVCVSWQSRQSYKRKLRYFSKGIYTPC